MNFSDNSFRPAARKYVKEQIPVISKKEAATRENLMLLGGLTIGLTAGVIIGAGVAALTMPRSGEETRQNIRDKRDYALNEVKETSSKVAGKVRDKADGVVDKIKERFSDDDEEVLVEYTIRYDDEEEVAAKAEEIEADDEEVGEEPEEDENA